MDLTSQLRIVKIQHTGYTHSLDVWIIALIQKETHKSHELSHGYPASSISQPLTLECGGYIKQVCDNYMRQVFGGYIQYVCCGYIPEFCCLSTLFFAQSLNFLYQSCQFDVL